jgi:hypothetical protein
MVFAKNSPLRDPFSIATVLSAFNCKRIRLSLQRFLP